VQSFGRIGAAISPAPEAYRYLPESVRKFPGADELAAEMRRSGFREVRLCEPETSLTSVPVGG